MGRGLYIASGLVAICATLLYIGNTSLGDFRWLARYVSSAHGNLTFEDVAAPVTSPSWNQLYHLGGNSPWIPKLSGLASPNTSVPEDCHVDQVHMVGTVSIHAVGASLILFLFTCRCQDTQNVIPLPK